MVILWALLGSSFFMGQEVQGTSSFLRVSNIENFCQMANTHKLSGVYQVTITPISEHTVSPDENYYIGFQDGAITFFEPVLVQGKDIIDITCRWLNIEKRHFLLEYLEKHHKGDSIYEFVSGGIETGLVQWRQIEGVMLRRIVIHIERVQMGIRRLYYARRAEEVLDWVVYGKNRHGFSYSTVESQLATRRGEWQRYETVIQDVNAVPFLHETRLATVTHEPTVRHLREWVNGANSLAVIAEGNNQDPLLLAKYYIRWVNEGLIYFPSTNATRIQPIVQERRVTQEQRVTTEPIVERLSETTNTTSSELPSILIVDDSPIVQTMLRRHLCEEYEVVSATNAVEGLAILNKRPIYLIISDVTMPDMDGTEFCRMVKKIEKLREIPIIMLTSKDSLIDRAKGHLSGASRYLVKPVTKEQILKVVKEYV